MKKLRLEKIDLVMAGLCLAAIIPGMCLWNELPDKIARHFDMNGDPDGYSGKLFVIVMLPLIMTAISLFTSILINSGRSKANPEKVKNLVKFIFPATLYVAQACILLYALDKLKNFMAVELTFFSVLIILIGNYMPKLKTNGVIGLRTSHTLNNEECWRVTHRFAGKVWVIGGIICLPIALMEKLIPFFIIFTLLIIIPVVYSEVVYRKIKKDEA